jgi:hypothetical protein
VHSRSRGGDCEQREEGDHLSEAAADLRGDPIAAGVLRLDASGAVTRTVIPTRQFFVDGVALAGGQLWLVDAVAGLLVRLPA